MTNTVNVRDFILTDDEIKAGATAPKATKKMTVVDYDQPFGSGSDFIIRRKTSRSEQFLVVNVSQGQYYIKNGEKVEQLDVTNMRKFMDAYPQNTMPVEGVTWLTAIPRLKDGIEPFLVAMKHQDEIKENLLWFDPEERYNPLGSLYRAYQDYPASCKLIRKGFAELSTQDFCNCICNYYNHKSTRIMSYAASLIRDQYFVEAIMDHYGLDNARDFIATFKKLPSPVSISSSGYYSSSKERVRGIVDVFADYKFKYRSMRDYILRHAYSEGYIDTSIWRTWMDVLSMQKQVYGKVKEKYPLYLTSMHHKLQYIVRERSVRYDEDKWKEAYENAKQFNYNSLHLVAFPPENREMLIDEAMQQSNCVAGYFDKMISGDCTIMFLRKKKEPDKSYVTLEIQGDEIVQAEMRFCQPLNGPARKALEKYAEMMDLKLSC